MLSIDALTLARVENSMNHLQFKLASHVFIEVLAILGGQFANCEIDRSHNRTNWQASYINFYWYLSQKSRVRLKQIDILYFNSIQWVHLCPLFLMNQVLKDPSQLIVSNTSNGIPKLDKKIAVLNKEWCLFSGSVYVVVRSGVSRNERLFHLGYVSAKPRSPEV